MAGCFPSLFGLLFAESFLLLITFTNELRNCSGRGPTVGPLFAEKLLLEPAHLPFAQLLDHRFPPPLGGVHEDLVPSNGNCEIGAESAVPQVCCATVNLGTKTALQNSSLAVLFGGDMFY